MNRTEIINSLIHKIHAQNYLEIGVADGTNFGSIVCANKIGVDPNIHSQATIHQTSDDFFYTNQQIFDVIFIDGLHHHNQVYRDINNSLLCLDHHGYIICHDMLPPSEEYQRVPPTQSLWTGDCWKAWATIRGERTDLQMHTVDTDYGCGIISKGIQSRINIQHCDLNWSNFTKYKDQWMNIVSIQEFKQIYL